MKYTIASQIWAHPPRPGEEDLRGKKVWCIYDDDGIVVSHHTSPSDAYYEAVREGKRILENIEKLAGEAEAFLCAVDYPLPFPIKKVIEEYFENVGRP